MNDKPCCDQGHSLKYVCKRKRRPGEMNVDRRQRKLKRLLARVIGEPLIKKFRRAA